MIDRLDTLCRECGNGIYIELRFCDDVDGVVHCSVCNHEVKRYPQHEDGSYIAFEPDKMCRYDNPKNDIREWWVDGECTSYMTRVLIDHMRSSELDICDPWVSGFVRGNSEAMVRK